MHSKTTIEDYKKRITRVIDYIYANLDEKLDGDKLADIACFSPYHWHRIYHAMTGETITKTVRRLRLHRASAELQHSNSPISAIAQRAGYKSVEAFNRAFSKDFALPPAAFRQSRTSIYPDYAFSSIEEGQYKVDIRLKEKFHLASVQHKGAYLNSGQAFDKLIIWASTKNLLNENTKMVGIYHHDPSKIAEPDLRTEAGIIVPETCTTEDPVYKVSVPGGPYAVLTHKGPYSDLTKAYTWLFGHWLPNSNKEVADIHTHEVYLNNPRETAPNNLLTELCLPLKSIEL